MSESPYSPDRRREFSIRTSPGSYNLGELQQYLGDTRDHVTVKSGETSELSIELKKR